VNIAGSRGAQNRAGGGAKPGALSGGRFAGSESQSTEGQCGNDEQTIRFHNI
jgi:hypothetical protein